jgi:hypothetical protein
MIVDYFIEKQKDSQEYFYDNIRIIIVIKKDKLTLFKNKKYSISIIIIDDDNNIVISNIKNICDFLIKKFIEKSHPYNKISIKTNWYIFNNYIDENNFNKINLKENIFYKNMINTFAVINNMNGEIFFNPQKIENKVISERMKFLYTEYQKEYPLDAEKEKQFSTEIFHLYEVMDIVLSDMR